MLNYAGKMLMNFLILTFQRGISLDTEILFCFDCEEMASI